MTAEQLEELLGKVTQGDWDCHYARPEVKCDCRSVVGEHGGMGAICTIEVDNGLRISDGGNDAPCESQARANAALIALAPSLARRVIAAEKLSQAVDDALTANGEWATVSVLNDAYREASK